MHKVFLTSQAEKDLSTLDEDMAARIIERLLDLRINPRSRGAKKLRGSKNVFRVRLGDWRILYDINNRTKHIRVFRIKHRSTAYR